MNIYGIGTDIVSIKRIQNLYEKFGDTFAKRILAQSEWGAYVESRQKIRFLAKRFAAKEATAKAFKTGFRGGLSLKHIALTSGRLGQPNLIFCDQAGELIDSLGISATHVTLSDESEYAVAFVVLERG